MKSKKKECLIDTESAEYTGGVSSLDRKAEPLEKVAPAPRVSSNTAQTAAEVLHQLEGAGDE